jgi:hypothetical protein
LALVALGACGFSQIEAKVKLHGGVEVSFAARDADDRPWFFDVAGGFTSSRPGLKRSEALWKALAKAAVVHEGYPATPLVVLTTAVPGRESSAQAALAALVGPARPIADVIVLSSATDLERLRLHAESTSPAAR